MEKYKYSLETNSADVNLYQCGIQFCGPNHSNGPGTRPYFLLHFVMEGKGIFQSEGGPLYHLKKGDAFLITPSRISYYCADAIAPWTYAWVAFDGIKAEQYLKSAGLSKRHPAYTAANPEAVGDALLQMVNYTRGGLYSEPKMMGYFYLFLAALLENSTSKRRHIPSQKEEYLRQLVQYINVHVWEKITVVDLASYIGLDRSYLYRIFKETLKLSPQAFILRTKMERAREMLVSTGQPVSQIARAVGYDDQLAFSRLFKKAFGASPREYRRQNQ